MAIVTNYIDLGGGTGTGTSGDPWGSMGEAYDEVVSAGLFGMNILEIQGSETLSEAIDFAGSAIPNGPVKWRGFETTPGDGGQATIDLNGYPLHLDDYPNVYFESMHFKNAAGSDCSLTSGHRYHVDAYLCEFSDFNCSGEKLWYASNGIHGVFACHFHDLDGIAVDVPNAWGCYFANDGTREMEKCGNVWQSQSNIVSIDGATDGFEWDGGGACTSNSIFCNGGTGTGILCTKADSVIEGNLIEGFSGTGGVGIDTNNWAYTPELMIARNYAYNCATNFVSYIATNPSGRAHPYVFDNVTLDGSPFAKSGSATSYANRRAFFAPQEDVLGKDAIMPQSAGAVQLIEAGGGSSTIVTPGPFQIGM